MGRGDSRNLKLVLFTMSVELSYLQLKTANDSRVAVSTTQNCLTAVTTY